MVRALAVLVVVAAACEQPPSVVERPVVEPTPQQQPASALAPAPAPTVTGSALSFVDRRGDISLRHGGMMTIGLSRNGRFAASGGPRSLNLERDFVPAPVLVKVARARLANIQLAVMRRDLACQ